MSLFHTQYLALFLRLLSDLFSTCSRLLFGEQHSFCQFPRLDGSYHRRPSDSPVGHCGHQAGGCNMKKIALENAKMVGCVVMLLGMALSRRVKTLQDVYNGSTLGSSPEQGAWYRPSQTWHKISTKPGSCPYLLGISLQSIKLQCQEQTLLQAYSGTSHILLDRHL